MAVWTEPGSAPDQPGRALDCVTTSDNQYPFTRGDKLVKLASFCTMVKGAVPVVRLFSWEGGHPMIRSNWNASTIPIRGYNGRLQPFT